MIENAVALNSLRAFFASEDPPPDADEVIAAILKEAEEYAANFGMLRPAFVAGSEPNTFMLVDLAGDPPSEALN
jgi:hypothetical protein